MLSLLFFIDPLAPGGKERRLPELMKALVPRRDINFELVLMSQKVHYNEVLNLGINIYYIIRKTKRDLSVFNKIFKVIRDYNPGIVHCWESMTAVYVTPACKLHKCKLVNGIVIDSPVKQNIFNKHWLRARLTFPFSDIVVGNSEAGLRAYKAPENKSRVIRNGFDFSRIENLIDENLIRDQLNIKTPFIIGMVASFSENKDYGTYFKSAEKILSERKDVTFLAIGTDTDSYSIRGLADNKYHENLRFLGARSGIESYINIMDICILSTYSEGISNSILEYMALGKPVIATSGGGTCEIVKDNETGYLISPSSPDQLAGKIKILLDDPVLRKKMGSAGRERIISEFSIDSMVRNYINLYNWLITN